MIACIKSLAVAMLITAASANPFVAKKSNVKAKNSYMRKLMNGAKATSNSQLHPNRKLDEDEEEYVVDISQYSLKFEKCQFVQGYSDELAEDEEYDSVLSLNRFIIFRLCPTSSCASSCNTGYGEYMVDMDEYLMATTEYRLEQQEEYCEECDENCEQDDQAQDDADRRLDEAEQNANVDCDTCVSTCQKIENMEENGYIDATNYLECAALEQNNDDDKEDVEYFTGAMCANSGAKIKIGVFNDENCMQLNENLDIESYLADGDGNQLKLSHQLLKTVYDPDECISCEQVDEDENNGDDGNDDAEVEIKEVCENVYMAAAKCEKSHSFDNGYSNYNGYSNQMANEEVVCDFIDSIADGTYDQYGSIVVGGADSSTSSSSSTTGGQKFALTFFILGTVGLAVYAAMLHTNLTKSAKADLSSQGGAMA